MKPLPMPIRIAAGLVATALEEVQQLPRKLSELPVTAVSQALQVSMRLQQRVTELAIKGDRALGALRPVPETPTWARFDEDEEQPATNGHGDGVSGFDAPAPPRTAPVRLLPSPGGTESEPEMSDVPEPRLPADRTESDEASTPTPNETASQPTSEPAEGQVERPEPTGPPGLPEYESWSLPQLRGRFRALSLEQLKQLLEWETSHQDRPPYVTMLSNRIASVSGR